MYFLCHLNGAFFHNISVTMEPHCAFDVVKNPSSICPINIINKIKTVSKDYPFLLIKSSTFFMIKPQVSTITTEKTLASLKQF